MHYLILQQCNDNLLDMLSKFKKIKVILKQGQKEKRKLQQ